MMGKYKTTYKDNYKDKEGEEHIWWVPTQSFRLERQESWISTAQFLQTNYFVINSQCTTCEKDQIEISISLHHRYV